MLPGQWLQDAMDARIDQAAPPTRLAGLLCTGASQECMPQDIKAASPNEAHELTQSVQQLSAGTGWAHVPTKKLPAHGLVLRGSSVMLHDTLWATSSRTVICSMKQ